MTPESQPDRPDDYDALLGNMHRFAAELSGLQELGVAQYRPVVQEIIASRSRDTRHIEHTLDYLLDFACCPAGLELYKMLCRYYFTIDPAATVGYIDSYRELWDNEEAEVGHE